MAEFIKNLRIKEKLIFSHGLIILMSVAIILCSIFGMKSIEARIEGLYQGPMTSVDVIGDLMYGTSDLQRTIIWSILREEQRSYSEFSSEVETNVALMNNAVEVMEGSLLTAEAQKLLGEIRENMESGKGIRVELMGYVQKGETSRALNLYLEYREYLNDIKAQAEQLNEMIRANGANYRTEAITLANTMIILVLVLTAVSLVFICGLVATITKMIATPVEQIRQVAEELYEGDLSGAHHITYQSQDELGVLAEAVRGSVNTLHEYVNEISDGLKQVAKGDLTKDGKQVTDFRGEFANIKESLLLILKNFNTTLKDVYNAAGQINDGSDQIASSAQLLAQGATEQASSVDELSATVTEISGKVTDTAENAATAKQEADETGLRGQNCNEQMKNMMSAMDEITQKSTEISKIVKTIEDIAFQTNILALNAAVEAARAGTAGKGFAVVADEVRNLASKSAEASKNTSVLIGGTVEAVRKGTTILAETAETLEQVVSGAESVSRRISEIAEAANQEASALVHVGDGIDQISKVVQTTSATAEENAAASEELSGQANVAMELISRFRLYGNDTAGYAMKNSSYVQSSGEAIPVVRGAKY